MNNKQLLFISRRDRGYVAGAFIFEVDTLLETVLQLDCNEEAYDYEIYVDGEFVDRNITEDYELTFDSEGVYQVAIKGIFPALIIRNTEAVEIKKILQWGRGAWSNLYLGGQPNLEIWAKDIPVFNSTAYRPSVSFVSNASLNDVGNRIWRWDIRYLVTLEYAFQECYEHFNTTLNYWDFSFIESIEQILWGDSAYTQDINWNTYSLINMQGAFSGIKSKRITLECANVSLTSGAFLNCDELEELYLYGISVAFDISTCDSLTGSAIDSLANTVADLSGGTGASVTMSGAQKSSCNQSLWTSKNWTILT